MLLIDQPSRKFVMESALVDSNEMNWIRICVYSCLKINMIGTTSLGPILGLTAHWNHPTVPTGPVICKQPLNSVFKGPLWDSMESNTSKHGSGFPINTLQAFKSMACYTILIHYITLHHISIHHT